MTKYIIKFKEQHACPLYYAGSDIRPENVWTTSAALATRFKDRTIAVSMRTKIAAIKRDIGTYAINEIQESPIQAWY